MPKMTIVTLPTTVVGSHRPVTKKTREFIPISLADTFSKMYIILVSLVHGKNGLLGILAFLLGRVLIMGEFAPVGLAFFAAVVQVDSKRAVAMAFWAIFGVASGGYYDEVGIYVFSIGLYFSVADKLSRRYKKNFTVPFIIFCGVLCAGIVINMYKETTLYKVLLVLFEAGTCMVLSYIFMYGVPLLTNRRILFSKGNLTSERLSCMVILLATAVAGLGDITVSEYSIRNMIGSVLVMIMALGGGAGFSTVMGVVVGLIVGISDGNASLAITLYAVAGVLAGVFRGLGKLAVILGFILGSAITVLYFGQDNELNRTLIECMIAGGLFLLVPGRWLTVWGSVTYSAENEMAKDSSRLKKAVVKINEIVDIFNALAVEFADITTANKEKIHDDELAKTLSAVGEQVCVDCAKRSQCWEVDFYRTYHGILELLGQVEMKSIDMNQMPVVFQEKCIRCKELLETVKNISERNRIVAFWQKKNLDTRQMVTEQMKAAGVIISGLTYEIDKVEYVDQELASALKEKTAILGCQLEAVQVTGLFDERVVEAWKKPCNGNRECINTILPLTAGLVKEKMILRTECGNEGNNQKCKLTMRVTKRFSVETGMVSLPKGGEEVCGDTCAVVELSQGKIALILSDGMGSGIHAQTQSKVAIHFLRKLLIAGFDTDVAVKTINSLLLLRSPEESFVTIDIAVVDTYSGEVDFLKIGSAPSFIKRVREVATIKSTSLPIGILAQIEIEPVKSVVVIGDFIVMVSDGIVDVPQNRLDKGNWLANFLRQSVNSGPQALAARILSQAQMMSNHQVADDMTVLVAKIIE